VDNSNGGTLGARGAAHIMANDPKLAAIYAKSFMAEQGYGPIASQPPSGSHIKNNYNQEQGHKVYAVTKDSLNEVKNEAGSMGPRQNSQTIRRQVDGKIASSQTDIVKEQNQIKKGGETIKQTVTENHKNGVNSRVYDKGVRETADIFIKDPPKGEPQQK
jgi:hypothetical protein